MGLLSALFPGPAAAETAINAAVKGIDSIWYTDEEKAQDKQKAKQAAADMYIRWMEATSGQNRARRAIALTITALWASTYASAILCDVAGPWLPADVAARLATSAETLRSGAADMNTPFVLVLGYYFGQRMLDAFKQPKDKT